MIYSLLDNTPRVVSRCSVLGGKSPASPTMRVPRCQWLAHTEATPRPRQLPLWLPGQSIYAPALSAPHPPIEIPLRLIPNRQGRAAASKAAPVRLAVGEACRLNPIALKVSTRTRTPPNRNGPPLSSYSFFLLKKLTYSILSWA
jgi:hypothetical protein